MFQYLLSSIPYALAFDQFNEREEAELPALVPTLLPFAQTTLLRGMPLLAT